MTSSSRPEQDEAVRLREALERHAEAHADFADEHCSEACADEIAALATPPPAPAALDDYSTDVLVAELRRRNLRLSSADDLLRGLSQPEILDFVDAGAVTADEARDYMRRARLSHQSEDA